MKIDEPKTPYHEMMADDEGAGPGVGAGPGEGPGAGPEGSGGDSGQQFNADALTAK